MHHCQALTVPEDFCIKLSCLLMEKYTVLERLDWNKVSCWPIFPAIFPLSCSSCALAGLLSFREDQLLPFPGLSCYNPLSAPSSAVQASALGAFSGGFVTWKSQWLLILADGSVCVNDVNVFILQTLPGVPALRAGLSSETGGLWHSFWDQGVGKIRLFEMSGTLQCSGEVTESTLCSDIIVTSQISVPRRGNNASG